MGRDELTAEYRELQAKYRDNPGVLAEINLHYIEMMNTLLFGEKSGEPCLSPKGEKMAKQSFAEWKKSVDEIVSSKHGIGCDDLPDVPYYDWWQDGYSPKEAAKEAVSNAQEV